MNSNSSSKKIDFCDCLLSNVKIEYFERVRIPDEKIQEIRNAADIVEYIGLFVRLKKRGKDYLGLCPFHQEKTPSFTVSANKQLFYCFGCHRGGDVVKFVMEYDKAGYIEALETLAEKYNIQITHTEEAYQSANETEKLYNVCLVAARFFYHNLRNTDEGKFALNYFLKRGFSDKTITTFGLGYSLRGWESLIRFTEQEGIQIEHVEKVGLVRKRDDGTFYDTFRGRAMFPIFNTTGRVIGFGARKLYDDDTVSGKYINSPETAVYHKSNVLYGLSQAKESIREKNSVVLVEGYADLISVSQAGTRNIVASSGTALASEQIQLIARYTKNITLVYDADSAGANAMMRGVDLILEGGLDVRVVQLPVGDDPDLYIQKNGGEAFEELIKKSVTFIDFKANTYRQEGKFETPEGKAGAVRGLVESIAKIKDQIKQSFFIKDVAEKYGLYESTLVAELEKFTRKVPDRFIAKVQQTKDQTSSEQSQIIIEPNEIPMEEKEIFSAIFEDVRQMIPFVFQHLQPEEFSHRYSKEIAVRLLNMFDTHGDVDPAGLMNSVDDENLKSIIANIAFERYQLGERWKAIGARVSETRLFEMALGAIKSVKKKNFERELATLRITMKNASLNGEDPIPFLLRQQEIFKLIKEIDAMKLIKQKSE